MYVSAEFDLSTLAGIFDVFAASKKVFKGSEEPLNIDVNSLYFCEKARLPFLGAVPFRVDPADISIAAFVDHVQAVIAGVVEHEC